jgi:hypothetical protein
VFLDVNGATFPARVRVVDVVPLPSPNVDDAIDPAASVDVPADATTRIRIEGDACAIGWHIAVATPAEGQLEPLELQPNPGLDPTLVAQNQFALALTQFRFEENYLEVRAALDFPSLSVVATWPIRFLPFERPGPHLVLVKEGLLVPALEGCDTVLTFANGWEERAPTCDQDLVGQLPSATKVRPGAPLALAFNGWLPTELDVICGAATGTGFIAEPRPGCHQQPEGDLQFVAPPAGDWTLAMGACAIAAGSVGDNRICGTWYARVDTR